MSDTVIHIPANNYTIIPEAYFNTTKEDGEALYKYRQVNQKQDAEVLRHFLRHRRLSPSQCYGYINGGKKSFLGRIFGKSNLPTDEVLLGSIRRSISTLTYHGYLQKIEDKDQMVMGVYGRREHVWMIIEKP